jgi:hypothetical protein
MGRRLAMGLALESLGLVERAREFAALQASLAEAAAGCGGVALVYVEAGIGKTSLVSSFCDDSSLPGEVLWGACDTCSRRVGYSAAFGTLTGDDEEALRQPSRSSASSAPRPPPSSRQPLVMPVADGVAMSG